MSDLPLGMTQLGEVNSLEDQHLGLNKSGSLRKRRDDYFFFPIFMFLGEWSNPGIFLIQINGKVRDMHVGV